MNENEDILRVCAWCNRQINDKNDAEGPVIPKQLQVGNKTTHGLCNACYAQQMKDLEDVT